MLFKTVYGPELAQIHNFLMQPADVTVESLEHVCNNFLPYNQTDENQPKPQAKNIEDALAFLKAAHLFNDDPSSLVAQQVGKQSFALRLFNQFQLLQQTLPAIPSLDLVYITLLNELFILPNQVWVADFHKTANELVIVRQVGGLSQEKTNAWRRVMEFLGVGYRIGTGFYCLYKPELVIEILAMWDKTEGTLQELLESYLVQWLPGLTAQNEIANSLGNTLAYLEKRQFCKLLTQQDSPARSYFGSRRLKKIVLTLNSEQKVG
jgi:hypothetical protein